MAGRLLFSVSDSEIFDAYMSAPSHFNEKLLLAEGRKRSILYSKHEDCASLARKLSRQVYGFRELQPIEDYFSQIGRSDKTAAIQIDAVLTQAEIKIIAEEFADSANADEQFTSYLDGANVVVNGLYTQTDFSRNRFRQRQQKEARVQFEIGPESTTITMPATSKGREIVAALRNKIEEKKKTEFQTQEVDLSGVVDPVLRTQFFVTLASEFPDSTLNDVLRVKLQGSISSSALAVGMDDGDDEDDDDDDGLSIGLTRAEEVVAGVLRGAALSGQDLFGTNIFQQLRSRGFFITSITWRSRLQDSGNPIVEFNAEFEDVEQCKSFRYSANSWKVRGSTGEYNESFASIPPIKKAELLQVLQRFAMSTMRNIESKASPHVPTPDEGGDDDE